MTPNEQKAYEWEKEFEDKFGGTKTYLYFARKPNDIKSFIASQIAQARADERRRIGEEVEKEKQKIKSDITVFSHKETSRERHEREVNQSYIDGLNFVLSLINKE